VEVVNNILEAMLQKMMNKHNTNWHHMLFLAIWAYQTSTKNATRFTPFHIVHDEEVVLPIEYQILSLQLVVKILPNTTSLEHRLVTLECSN
jgi:hypothetical protein